MMNPRDIERLFREYHSGDRVVAVMDIIYGDGFEVAEGTEGMVEAPRWQGVRALPLVRWSTGLCKATSTTALDPAACCVVCGKSRHDDGSRVTWRCRICDRYVCRECTRRIPGSQPEEYYELTLCSDKCWEAAGRPSD